MAWTVSGNIKGPKGDTGAQGPQGAPGVDGKGISIAGSVATYAALPGGLTGADAGKGYLVQADGLLYIWSGSAFPANGSGVAFQGPKGDTGAAGAQGIQGIQGIQGAKGDKGDTGAAGSAGAAGAQGVQGIQGPAGTAGSAGARGATWFNGTGAPGTVAGSSPGDFYLDTASGDVYKLS